MVVVTYPLSAHDKVFARVKAIALSTLNPDYSTGAEAATTDQDGNSLQDGALAQYLQGPGG